MGQTIVFYGLGSLSVLSAFLTITREQPVTAIMWFLGFILSLAGMFIVLKAEFLGMMQLFLYGDAITVIFLFVIMAMNLPESKLPEEHLSMSSLITIALGGLFMILLAVLVQLPNTSEVSSRNIFDGFDVLAETLFVDHLLAFEMLSVLLLVAMIGVVVLSRKSINS